MQRILYAFLLFCPAFLFGQNTYTAPEFGELIVTGCSGIIYDSGGPDANYTDDNQSLIYIQGEGDYLELTFTEFDIENIFDELYILEGNGAEGQVIGVYSGNTLPNDGNPIQIPGNEVTIFFMSDFTINAPGFALEFACAESDNPPVANAGFPSLTCNGTVAFSDASTSFPDTWEWDFGDGNTSSEEDPIHTYASDGTYTVTLTACNENGCDTFTGEIVFDSEDFACSNGVNIPANGTEETTVCNGILFDPGGPDGDYPEGAHGQFIISPPGATSVSVTFTEFNLGTSTGSWFSDAVYIYDTETSENLGYYTGTDLPNNGQPLVFNTSSITVVFSSDHYDNFSGFAMLWQANGTTEPPVAAFSTGSLTVPLNAPVQFTDESENNPGLWEWTFGDGGTSDAQNPTYVFTEPGTYEINLTVGNCNGSDTAEAITITVQEAPSITHNPESYNITLNAGDIGTEVLTICNEGAGDLLVDLAAQGANSGVGFQFGFNTNENGENFYWQLLDQDLNVVQEDFGPFAANSTYTAVITGLNPEGNYYILLGSSDDSQTLETLLWYDAVGGEVFFEGFVTTGSDAIYWLGAPWVGEISAPWLASETEPGTIAPGACEEYTITFDASELNGGVYEGEIVINSNDSNNSTITIPVTLTVIGTPELVLSAENLDFGEVQVGGSASLDLTISNPGSDVLEVSGISLGNSVFSVSGAESVSLNPDAETTVTVSFSPEAITSYSETMTLVNNAGDDAEISVTGIGIAAPSLTLNPTEFTLEMISGQDTTLNVTAGNVGEAVLNYVATAASDGTGFLFNFTTDNWSGEFSWILTDSQGNQVLTSEGEFYEAFTTYDVLLSGLSTDETYTLLMFDIFGDGSLTDFTVTDLGSGAVVAQGSFPLGVFEYSETLGSPAESFVSVTPESGNLAINAEQILDIYIDTEGLSTGTYNIVVTLATNDPLQPTADVNITLYVIAPVVTDFAATPEFVCGNLPVQFTDETANVATSWSWDFGDGTTSELQNPTHTYAEDGSYTVTLTACNSLGCETLTKEDYVTVELGCYAQNIPPEHQTETITVCSGNVYDSGGPNGDYLEGNFGTLIIAPPGAQQVTITFTEFNYEEHSDFLYVYDGQGANAVLLGAYTGNDLEGVTLTADSGVLTLTEYTGHFVQLSGFVATFNCNADPVQPVADFTYLGDSVCVNEPFLFFDQSTGNPDSWFWDFGNGFTSNEQNPVINFTASDTVNVSLTACNEIGCDTYIFEDVIIILDKECFQDEIPDGGFEGETTIINSCAGFLYDSGGEEGDYNANNLGAVTILRPEGVIGLSFTEFNYSDGDFVYVIDGDSFDDPIIGAYTGTELPEDGAPITSTGSVITIVEYTFSGVPASGFALSYTCTTEGENIGNLRVYNDEICDGILRFGTPEDVEVDTWQWNFGDGTTSTEAAPVHEYAEHGAYEVELVTCYQGVCQTQTTTIYSNKLVPEIEAPFAAALGEEVHFHGLTEQATHWNWDFGNGETSDHNTPSTVYTELGVHEVHIHLVNMNVHSTCDANHLHTVTVTEDGTTSSTEVETNPVKIFPNPTSNFVRVDAGGSTIDNLRLRSIDGREIRRAEGVDRMDVGDLPSGTYFLEVQTDGQLPKQFKVVVQR